MAQTERPQNVGAQHQHSSPNKNFPDDLLQRFISRNHFNHKVYEETEEEEEEGGGGEVELSLGLSLNGKFGVDPRAKMLGRSSSIPDFIKPERENGSAFSVPLVGDNLVRTCSLPSETQEEWRKRKEMQTHRRMEAKRKRSQKQLNSKAVKGRKRGFGEGSFEEDRRENGFIVNHQNYHQEQLVKNPNGSSAVGLDRFVPPALVPAPLSQGSIGSQGSGSSGISESESQQVRGINQCTEARSPAGVQCLLECEQKLMVLPGSTASEKSVGAVGHSFEVKSRLTGAETKAKETVRSVFEDMPCVSTRGDGPNGKRIEGFLYRYGKGEEVRIMCVCHGSFFSPAEFVEHSGGFGVEHPLKHIVVNPSPLL